MAQDALYVIGAMYNSLTKAEKKVADVVLKKPQQIPLMSISDLAELAGVGDSTVFRFCQTLQYKGYQDFKMGVLKSLPHDRSVSLALDEEIHPGDTLAEVADKVLAANISALGETRNLLDLAQLDRAVDMMVKADKIMIVGAGLSLLTGFDAFNRFLRITPKVKCTFDTHLQAVEAALSGPGDLALVISFSGLTRDTVDSTRIAKESGASVLAITRYLKSPLTDYADVTLISGANEGPLQGGSTTVKMSQLYLLDILYVEYFRRTTEVSMPNKEKGAAAILGRMY